MATIASGSRSQRSRSKAFATRCARTSRQNEALIFEKSSPGKKAYKMPPLDVPEVDPESSAGRSRTRATWA